MKTGIAKTIYVSEGKLKHHFLRVKENACSGSGSFWWKHERLAALFF